MIIGSFLRGQSRARRFLWLTKLTIWQGQSFTKLKFTFRNRLPMPDKIFLEMLDGIATPGYPRLYVVIVGWLVTVRLLQAK